MLKIGIIGGLSSQSTAQYYININKKYVEIFGTFSRAEIIIFSVNLQMIMLYAIKSQWEKIASIFIDIACRLQEIGADFVVIPCNSFHIIAEDVQNAIKIPLLNIIDSVGRNVLHCGYSKIGLLGSDFTAKNSFYTRRLLNRYNLSVVLPSAHFQQTLHHIIVSELCYGILSSESKHFVKFLCENMYAEQKCEAIVLACTELPLLLRPQDTIVPLILSTDVHSNDIVNYSLGFYEQD
ncbi:MAG: hypothetical protein A3F10_00375 [Coxiella sp. RIFCSPHIGHO2_12_FULL_42_15]|nr:MAG: hypothetical protein A3F10_00375 [Coxiella sp. RIFCSPHIGHO2_12_FULL_42_15]